MLKYLRYLYTKRVKLRNSPFRHWMQWSLHKKTRAEVLRNGWK